MMFAYVGSRTTRERNARGEGISVFKVNTNSAELEQVQVVSGLVNPSFLALDATGNRLYSVHGDLSCISAFSVNRASGTLRHLNTQDTGGRNPVHLAIDPRGRYIVVSNHIGASLAVLPIEADGSLGAVCQLIALDGQPGPHRVEQPHAKPHHNPFSPDGRHVIVPDKGLDCIFSYRFGDRGLEAADPPVMARESSGPRHIVFHPQRPLAYCINELDSTVTTYRYDAQHGRLTPLQILPTLPATFTGNSRGAEITIDPAGRYLYTSNRGHDSVAVFGIDPSSGMLSWTGCQPTEGRTPRFIAITPDGRHLYALNEDDDKIVAFRVDAETGALRPNGVSVETGSPVCMVFSRTSD